MSNIPVLSIITFIPFIVGVCIKLFTSEDNSLTRKNVLWASIWGSIVTLIITILVSFNFDYQLSDYQFIEYHPWFYAGKTLVSYKMGIDILSLLFIILTILISIISLLVSYQYVEHNFTYYIFAIMSLQTCIIGCFTSLDLVLFFLFFELMLIPMFFVIGIWGGENRLYSAVKFFIYTFFGSILSLFAFIYIILTVGSSEIDILQSTLPTYYKNFSLSIQYLLWFSIFIAFAVKIPIFPFHTWLPDAHVQAPTTGSILLAGILIKIGAYGLIRFLISFFPDLSNELSLFAIIPGVIGIIYGSIIALAQTDLKKVIAYSSVAHMGYVVLGLFSFNKISFNGAIFQMISHGIISSGLFLCVGVLYYRIKSREISNYGGVSKYLPYFSGVFLLLTMGSIALPGTMGFVGEFLVILGSFKFYPEYAILASTGVILGASYMLYLYKNVMLGECKNAVLSKQLFSLTIYESFSLFILASLVILFGVMPWLILTPLDVLFI